MASLVLVEFVTKFIMVGRCLRSSVRLCQDVTQRTWLHNSKIVSYLHVKCKLSLHNVRMSFITANSYSTSVTSWRTKRVTSKISQVHDPFGTNESECRLPLNLTFSLSLIIINPVILRHRSNQECHQSYQGIINREWYNVTKWMSADNALIVLIKSRPISIYTNM